MSGKHVRFDDDVDDVQSEISDSEDENILKNNGNQAFSSEEEVYGIHSDSDESDNDELALSDVEGQEEDELPNIRAWGKEKKKYYSTDYVDPDYGNVQGKDAVLADLEEQEAKQLQMQLMQQLEDADFNLDTYAKKSKEDTKEVEEIVQGDLSKLSKRQKLEMLQAEAPEFFGLVEDTKIKLKTIESCMKIMNNPEYKTLKSDENVSKFIQQYLEIMYNYLLNISVYLLLKSRKVLIKSHPVIKRLFEFKNILMEMDKVYDSVVRPQLSSFENINVNEETQVIEKNKRLKKKVKVSKKQESILPTQKLLPVASKKEEEVPEVTDVDNGDTKRAITYQMAKNKGLMPHRKKEQRNPRVKHRMKFRKAKIRRKGAVREVRKELSRYAGEISGIKSTVKKSISIKS